MYEKNKNNKEHKKNINEINSGLSRLLVCVVCEWFWLVFGGLFFKLKEIIT